MANSILNPKGKYVQIDVDDDVVRDALFDIRSDGETCEQFPSQMARCTIKLYFYWPFAITLKTSC